MALPISQQSEDCRANAEHQRANKRGVGIFGELGLQLSGAAITSERTVDSIVRAGDSLIARFANIAAAGVLRCGELRRGIGWREAHWKGT
jgi:hypothetical protein